MFSSRHFAPSPHPHTILVEIPPTTLLDTPVLPAALSYILSDLNTTLTRHTLRLPNITLASIDNPPSLFQNLSDQLVSPKISIVDAFSHWYPTAHNHPSPVSYPHIAATHPTSPTPDSLISHISTAFQKSPNKTSPHRIVILDSLSTLLRYWPGIETLLSLRDSLANIPHSSSQQAHKPTSLTLIATFHSPLPAPPILASLRRTSHTHISLTQGPPFPPHYKPPISSSDPRDIVTLQSTRRKPSGRVQLDTIHARIDCSKSILTEITHADITNSDVTSAKDKDHQRKQRDAMMENLGLSFRVGVTTQEREVRAAVGLSYLHRDEELADSALVLHPKVLQIGPHAVEGESDDSTDSEEEELFSEDV